MRKLARLVGRTSAGTAVSRTVGVTLGRGSSLLVSSRSTTSGEMAEGGLRCLACHWDQAASGEICE